ncbi:MAG: hypothetical protein OEM51_05785, partial [Gammaproteobacteria bacterium]|nr:hypothetical protein [Gammaproteobacteria bacterium]
SGNAALERIELIIAGIDSIEAFAAVQELLSATNLIENFIIAEVEGDRIRYRVEALGGAERLGRALRFNGLIEQNGFDGDRPGRDPLDRTLEFFYSP